VLEVKQDHIHELTEHFFRNEYGKMVSVITRYVGTENVQAAEDIVQETLLKAVDHWQHNGIPDNPQAWLYTTAKNLALNILKRRRYHSDYIDQSIAFKNTVQELEKLEILEDQISDDQLKMMFVCCHSSISEKAQISLILKTLCGFSISEIATAFFTSNDAINKRLVRARKQLRVNKVKFDLPSDINQTLPIVLKAIFLLFNEGYSPSHKNQLVRYSLCLEAIRLAGLLIRSEAIEDKSDCYALMALMHLNAARFDSRMNDTCSVIEMEKQDRTKWNQELINRGVQFLNSEGGEKKLSVYLILASISANHCISQSIEETDWNEILSLYDSLLEIEDTPIVRLNRSVPLSKVKGYRAAIAELQSLSKTPELSENFLYHSTIAEFYKMNRDIDRAKNSYSKAISCSTNIRDTKLLQKKLIQVVPVF